MFYHFTYILLQLSTPHHSSTIHPHNLSQQIVPAHQNQSHNKDENCHSINNINHPLNYVINNMVKSEIEDDDFDDENLSLTHTNDQDILDFSKFTGPSTSPTHYVAHELDEDLEIDDDDDCINDNDDNSLPSILQSKLQGIKPIINHNNNPDDHNNKTNHVYTKEMLISVAIEERRKKIELLETQINYWKKLTTKIENCDKICCCKIENYNNRNFVIE